MKNLVKAAIILLTAIGGCKNMKYDSTELNGIQIDLTNVKTKPNGTTGFTVVEVYTTIKNLSKEKISRISYEFQVYDKDNKMMKSYNFYYYGDDKSLDEGQSVKDYHGFQDKFESKPASYKVKIIEASNTEEFPLVHVPQPGEYLYQVIVNEKMNNIKNELPVNIHVHIDHMGAADVADVNDIETIQRLVDLFTDIKIYEETNKFVTDNYNWVKFTFADGSESGISLNLYTYETRLPSGRHGYTLENFGEFWRLCNQLAKSQDE